VARSGRGRLVLSAVVTAGIGTALCAVLVTHPWHVARLEAWINGTLIDAFGLSGARAVGAAVIFPLNNYYVGFLVTPGCSIVYPAVAPLVAVVALIAVRRVGLIRGLMTALAAISLLILVNQIRLATVVASIQAWGMELGYQRSHVLLGSTVSTLGMIAVAILFVLMLGRRGTRRAVRRARHVRPQV
jgi:exosortase/archaeosortase family protein